jgi:hypothetical protein
MLATSFWAEGRSLIGKFGHGICGIRMFSQGLTQSRPLPMRNRSQHISSGSRKLRALCGGSQPVAMSNLVCE